MLFSQEANDEAYKYWRSTVLPRIKNPEKARLLAPEKPPHPFGTKRCSLEVRVYEVLDQDHVSIVSVNETPVLELTETGLRTSEGLVEVDVSGWHWSLRYQGRNGAADHAISTVRSLSWLRGSTA